MRSATNALLQNTCGRDNQAPACTLQGFPGHCLAEAPRSSTLLHARISATAAPTAPSGQNKRSAYQFPEAAHLPCQGQNKLRHMSTILQQQRNQAHARLRSHLPKILRRIYTVACLTGVKACYIVETVWGAGMPASMASTTPLPQSRASGPPLRMHSAHRARCKPSAGLRG